MGSSDLGFVSLLAKGLLPREVPPPFSSVAFAGAVGADGASLGPVREHGLVHHSIPRLDGARRALGIPNPVGFVPLAHALCERWPALAHFYARSRFSVAGPMVLAGASRALITGASPRARRYLAGRPQARAGFTLRADIARCSESVSHEALEQAESTLIQSASRSPAGSLARHASRLQRGTRRGLPAGPDSTMAMLELLLTAVDLELEQAHPALQGSRRCDNYELDCRSESEAVEVRELLDRTLRAHGFALHPEKTSITSGARAPAAPWWLRLDELPLRQDHLADDLPLFAEQVVALVESNRGEPVADRALGRLLGHGIETPFRAAVGAARLRIAAAAPTVLRFVLHALVAEWSRGLAPDAIGLERELNAILERHASCGDASEVAWTLWAAIATGTILHSDSVPAMVRMHDDVVAVLALEAQSRGLLRSGLDTSGWTVLLDEHALRGEHWLLAYEAAAHGWLCDAPGVRAVATDREFGPLLRAGVRFFEPALQAAAA